MRRGRLLRKPVTLTQPPKRSRTHRKISWSFAECRRFLDAIADHRLYVAFHLALVTGVRRGELLGLRWEDVDLDTHLPAPGRGLLADEYKRAAEAIEARAAIGATR